MDGVAVKNKQWATNFHKHKRRAPLLTQVRYFNCGIVCLYQIEKRPSVLQIAVKVQPVMSHREASKFEPEQRLNFCELMALLSEF
jgi:hypothetical protein